MTALVKIRFTRDALLRVYGYAHPENPVFKAGEIHEVDQQTALRWYRRGVAEAYQEPVKNVDKPQATAPAAVSKVDSIDAGNSNTVDDAGEDKAKPRNQRRNAGRPAE